jgi:hypothetical protein
LRAGPRRRRLVATRAVRASERPSRAAPRSSARPTSCVASHPSPTTPLRTAHLSRSDRPDRVTSSPQVTSKRARISRRARVAIRPSRSHTQSRCHRATSTSRCRPRSWSPRTWSPTRAWCEPGGDRRVSPFGQRRRVRREGGTRRWPSRWPGSLADARGAVRSRAALAAGGRGADAGREAPPARTWGCSGRRDRGRCGVGWTAGIADRSTRLGRWRCACGGARVWWWRWSWWPGRSVSGVTLRGAGWVAATVLDGRLGGAARAGRVGAGQTVHGGVAERGTRPSVRAQAGGSGWRARSSDAGDVLDLWCVLTGQLRGGGGAPGVLGWVTTRRGRARRSRQGHVLDLTIRSFGITAGAGVAPGRGRVVAAGGRSGGQRWATAVLAAVRSARRGRRPGAQGCRGPSTEDDQYEEERDARSGRSLQPRAVRAGDRGRCARVRSAWSR